MLSRFAAVPNKEISHLIKLAVPEIHEEGEEVQFGGFNRRAFCLFDLNLSIKQVKKFFIYEYKLSLSLALLFFVDLVINKLKLNLITFFRERF